LGRHQIENAKVAILLVEELSNHFKISPQDIVDGLRSSTHRGRLEFRGDFLFDGAHNASGAKALREFLDEFIDQPITMVFGSMRDKDLTEIAQSLFPKASKLILTKPDNPRASEASEISTFVAKEFPKENLFLTDSVNEALIKARQISKSKDLILVTGSLYLIGEVQKILQDQAKI
jgi:dihydrofolate synthase/folylpolyglutamate synthase